MTKNYHLNHLCVGGIGLRLGFKGLNGSIAAITVLTVDATQTL